jgi:hypothetical protein
MELLGHGSEKARCLGCEGRLPGNCLTKRFAKSHTMSCSARANFLACQTAVSYWHGLIQSYRTLTSLWLRLIGEWKPQELRSCERSLIDKESDAKHIKKSHPAVVARSLAAPLENAAGGVEGVIGSIFCTRTTSFCRSFTSACAQELSTVMLARFFAGTRS